MSLAGFLQLHGRDSATAAAATTISHAKDPGTWNVETTIRRIWPAPALLIKKTNGKGAEFTVSYDVIHSIAKQQHRLERKSGHLIVAEVPKGAILQFCYFYLLESVYLLKSEILWFGCLGVTCTVLVLFKYYAKKKRQLKLHDWKSQVLLGCYLVEHVSWKHT